MRRTISRSAETCHSRSILIAFSFHDDRRCDFCPLPSRYKLSSRERRGVKLKKSANAVRGSALETRVSCSNTRVPGRFTFVSRYCVARTLRDCIARWGFSRPHEPFHARASPFLVKGHFFVFLPTSSSFPRRSMRDRFLSRARTLMPSSATHEFTARPVSHYTCVRLIAP